MRRFFHTALAAIALTGAAAAQAPDAQTALVERLGLLEIDQRCRLLPAAARTALTAGAAQARGALLRAGWTLARVDNLETAVRQAASERGCHDARTRQAVAGAREAYASWARAGAMEFPGWERAWIARRAVGPNGWRLSQEIDEPLAAAFGVREAGGGERLSLIVPGANAANARLVLRDGARSGAAALDLTHRMAYGLEAGAPGPGVATLSFRAAPRVERTLGRSQTVFTFPDEAFAALLALDPRESVTLEVIAGRTAHTIFVEVGDVAAARTFLSLRTS